MPDRFDDTADLNSSNPASGDAFAKPLSDRSAALAELDATKPQTISKSGKPDGNGPIVLVKLPPNMSRAQKRRNLLDAIEKSGFSVKRLKKEI